MKRLKALIKIELPSTLIVTLYFIVVSLGLLIATQGKIADKEGECLFRTFIDIAKYQDMLNCNDIFLNVRFKGTILFLIGCALLVYSSFRKDKDYEIGRFLKSLPYTTKERLLVKVGMHLGSLLIGILTFGIGMSVVNHQAMNRFRYIYEGISGGELHLQIMASHQVLKMMIVTLLTCITFYLFLLMMQYVMMNNLMSVVNGVLIFFAPIYLSRSLLNYFRSFIGNIIDVVCVFLKQQVMAEGKITMAYRFVKGREYSVYIDAVLGSIKPYVISYGICIIIILALVYVFYKRYKLEESDLMIPNKYCRGIYRIGVTVCSAFLVGDVMRYLTGTYVYGNESLLNPWLLIGAAIGFIISKKIAQIGIKKGGVC